MFNLSVKFDEKKFMRNIEKTVVKKLIRTWKIPSSIFAVQLMEKLQR